MSRSGVLTIWGYWTTRIRSLNPYILFTFLDLSAEFSFGSPLFWIFLAPKVFWNEISDFGSCFVLFFYLNFIFWNQIFDFEPGEEILDFRPRDEILDLGRNFGFWT